MKKERVEFTILRYLGRPPSLFDDQAIAEVQKILESNTKFDWDKFTEYAVFHKLSQTLYPNMKTYAQASCPPSPRTGDTHVDPNSPFTLPPKVVKKFRGIFFANAARNEFLAQELVRINRLLEDNGIEVLNWKGPALAIQAYGDLSLRQFKDLDTLVKHEDLERAKAILLENGFDDITPQNRNPEFTAGRGYEFINENKRYEVELEYSIFLARTVLEYDYEGMFDRASSITIGNDKINTLSLEDNLLFTSFHGTKHLWFRLRWLADILGKFELNKDEILSTIDTFEQKKLIAFCIYIAHKEFNMEQPIEISGVLSDKLPSTYKFEHIIHTKIVEHNSKDTSLNHYWKAKIIATLINGNENKKEYLNDIEYFNLWKRIKIKISPNQADYNLIKLPKLLYPLYFIVRPLRVFIRVIKRHN